MTKGTYTLLIELPDAAEIDVGALGERSFERGWYAYTGSAFGPGGFARIDRHRELACGERTVRHWHVDYLLGHPTTRIDVVWTTPHEDRECEIARLLPGELIASFGASDCDCDSHLAYTDERETLTAALADLHDECDDDRGV